MVAAMNRLLRQVPVAALWLAGLIPAAWLLADVIGGRAGVDPIPVIEHRLGRTALYFLIASLCVSPVLRLTRLNLIRFRRGLGLLCFLYAALHVAAWVVLDMGMLWGQIARDLGKRPYLLLGLTSLAILVPLAVTSSDAAVRRLAPRWRQLHALVYIAAPLAALHWIVSLKLWQPKPLLILAAILVLLALRSATRRPRSADNDPAGRGTIA